MGSADPSSTAPDLPDNFVELPRLLDQLDQITARAVSLVVAPAGTGKTTLLAAWSRRRCGLPVHWVSATSPAAIADLTRAVRADPGELAPDHLDQAFVPGAPLVLVVDGVDTPEASAAAFELASIAAAGSAGIHVVIVGRCPPPPTIVTLRLSAQVWELPPAELLLDVDEAVDIVARYSTVPVSIRDPSELAGRFDGWLVGLALAGMAATGAEVSSDDLVDAAIELIEDYVATSILGSVDEELRQFLLRTAFLDDLDPGLCDLVTDRVDSARVLTRGRSAGVPMVRTSSRSVRVVAPVRIALQTLAVRDDPSAEDTTLRRAADWYSRHGKPFEAAACFVRLEAWLDVATVITFHIPTILERDEIGRVADLIRIAPGEVLREHATLALAGAWVLRMDGQVTAAVELMGIYEPYLSERARMIADVNRASVADWSDDMDAAIEFAERALAACDQLGDDALAVVQSPLPATYGPTSVDAYRSRAHDAALLAGAFGARWDTALEHLVDVEPATWAKLPQVQHVILHGSRALYFALCGRALDAAAEAHVALSTANTAHLSDTRPVADAVLAAGYAKQMTLQHGHAQDLFTQAQDLAERSNRHNLVALAAAAQVNLAVDAGTPEVGLELAEGFRSRAPHRYPPTVAGLVVAAHARALTGCGRFPAALRLLEGAPLTPAVASARVAVCLGQGDVSGAQSGVRDWPPVPTVDSIVRRAFAAAVICNHTGDRRRAALLRTAIDAAGPHRLLQPFVEFGPGVARLIRQHASQDSLFTEDLMRWIGGSPVTSSTPRFTAREAMVMSHIAEGKRVREVADTIHVSVNTVRSHLQSAYRKLGVGNRADAVRAWRGAHPGHDAGA
jgi:LuxR family maltose regulon positive regulatory protein